VLALPKPLLAQIPPRPFRYGASQELFERNTGLVFDAIAPPAAAAGLTFGVLLHPQRAARPGPQETQDGSLPGLDEVIERVHERIVDQRPRDAYHEELTRTVERVYVESLMRLAARAGMPQVRAIAAFELDRIARNAATRTGSIERA